MKAWRPVFLAALVCSLCLAWAISCGGDDDDDDTGDDDSEFIPESFCAAEQACWAALDDALSQAKDKTAYDAAVNDYYACMGESSGCTGQYLDCIDGCAGDGECLQGCDSGHFACLGESCAWDSDCYGSCYGSFAPCYDDCGDTDWSCRRFCHSSYVGCIEGCW